ncbi:MAG: PorT family protein [Bacteroidia bacterium]|nr:PorT family protein [Bacteroidia bacterium]
MRIISTLIFLLLLAPFSTTTAQNKRGKSETNRVFMELGPSQVWLQGNDQLGADLNDVGFTFGVGWCKPLNGPLYTHTGVFVARKGNRLSDQLIDATGQPIGLADIRTRQDYLIVPYMVRLELGERIRFYLEGGAYGGLLIRAEQIAGNTGPQFAPIETTETLQRIDYGLLGGTGIVINVFDNFCGTIGARYNHGLYNISKGADVVNNATLDLRIGIGVWLP